MPCLAAAERIKEEAMRKIISAALTGVLLLGILGGCADSGSASGQTVSVEAVSSVVSAGSVGLADWYAGMVVAGDTEKVKRDSNKTVLETYVKQGDMVAEGDPLFAYDVEKMQLDLDNLYLKKADYENTISSANAEISELEKQRDEAKEADKLSYTLQIDSRKADIREAQYNMSVNDRDIASMEASLEHTVVDSPIAGRIMTVDETGGSSNYGYYGDQDQSSSAGIDYITVTDVNSMRIQGNINEMNAYSLSEGMEMTIRSRTDSEQTWTGTLSLIDWENPVQNTNNNDSGVVYVSSPGSGDDGMTTSSKYPFYIELDSTDGLLMGQHVYIEPYAGEEQSDEPAGPMLPGYYIVQDDGDPYVWADNGKGKLEKRSVTLGQYDESSDAYEIVDGLDLSDYIAFPAEELSEGQATEKFDPAAAMEEDLGGGAEVSAQFEY